MKQITLRELTISMFLNFILLGTFSFNASADKTYKFERMWPTLQQPWYFAAPFNITIDKDNCIYVVVANNDEVLKFNANGQLVSKFGSNGTGDGQFNYPYSIASDDVGHVYVADYGNYRIQKFTADGQFIGAWGSYGSGEGQFIRPTGIALDNVGYAYVLDSGYNRIQKFTTDGDFITQWGGQGSGDGEFNFNESQSNTFGQGIAISSGSTVYVADYGNHRVQVFTTDGQYLDQWGGSGTEDGQFGNPDGISVDHGGNVYVVDRNCDAGYRIQEFTPEGEFIKKWGGPFVVGPSGIDLDSLGKVFVTDFSQILQFTPDGQIITKWSSGGSGNGQFNLPEGMAIDVNGNTYIADTFNHRIQKFGPVGQYITQWGGQGSGDGEFNFPTDIAIDSDGNFYVADMTNSRIQKFDSNGTFLTKWGSRGTDTGEFLFPRGISVDSSRNIYVVDTDNQRVQKFKPPADGLPGSPHEFDLTWGSEGSGNGQFYNPHFVAVGEDGYVYVSDSFNGRIQKFTSDGDFVTTWGSGDLIDPNGIAIDDNGNVYVADSNNHRVQKYTSNGYFIETVGTPGSDIGQMTDPWGIAIGPNGKVYIVENKNNRVQVFKPASLATNNKAIIVAGGGPFSGNNLWDATQMNANFAYRTLTYQGFTKQTIYYLTSDTDLDLDNNGVLDDVDGDATNSNLQHAITEWGRDADSVLLYLTDHGGSSKFRMNDTETLSATDLNTWLNALQEAILGKVIVVYDACESGSFLPSLIPPAGKERIVLTSTSPGEPAKFVTQGSVSFSNYFWTHIFNGLSVKDAFDRTNVALCISFEDQHPLMDANGNGVGNEEEDYDLTKNTYIGNGTVISGDAPMIGSISPPQTISGKNSATFYAESVADDKGIGRVWAVIRSPDYMQGSSENPVTSLPSIDLMPVGGDRYEGTYTGFNIAGTYQIAIYAMDRIGNTGIPELTTVSVDNPLRRRAIIVAGGSSLEPFWPAVETSAGAAYEALTFQGYTNDDIYFMSPVAFSVGVDGLPTLSNIEYAVTGWAESNTQDLVLYLIGNGDSGTFTLSETEDLSAIDLDIWLDSLQKTVSGKVTVIYEACRSGSFLPLLTPPSDKERILITSTSDSESAYFISGGDLSFSKYFWSQVANGSNVRDAFLHGKNAIQYSCKGQTPQMDDNGNGIGNEKADGVSAMNYTIGAGIMLGGDEPIIGSVCPAQTLSGGTSATLWAKDVTSTNNISKVWAVITPPDFYGGSSGSPITDLPMIELIPVGSSRYEGIYRNFNTSGIYTIAIFAVDSKGALSLPIGTTVNASGDNGCLTVGNDLSISVPCVQYLGNLYGLTLGFYSNPGDPSGYYWTLVPGAFKAGEGDYCLYVGSDLRIPIPCVAYNGKQFEFTLDFYPNPYAAGLYWKMDPSTFKMK